MKIGLLGAGRIAGTMAATVSGLAARGEPGIEAWAVGARDYDRAAALAKEFGFARAYGSYKALLSDPEVDLIYIATPHSHHYEHVKLCLEHGKHVLCEKAFTVNAAQAREIIDLAQAKGLLLTEAIWPRYMPSRAMIDQVLARGEIGTPRSLTASLNYDVHDKERMLEPALAGGALLDLGVYPINFAMMAFGDNPASISGAAVLTDKGVDARESITMIWPDGKIAVLHADMYTQSNRLGVINGSKGYLEVQNINNPEELRVYDMDYNLVKAYQVPTQITGYEYEVLACRDALTAGETECAAMPHDTTIQVMELMDSLRRSWNVIYPFE